MSQPMPVTRLRNPRGRSSSQGGDATRLARHVALALCAGLLFGGCGTAPPPEADIAPPAGRTEDVAASQGLEEAGPQDRMLGLIESLIEPPDDPPSLESKKHQSSQRPLPWILSLSASGEKIQLVRDLNQQVLTADLNFIEARRTQDANLKLVLAALLQSGDRLGKSDTSLTSALIAPEKDRATIKSLMEARNTDAKNHRALVELFTISAEQIGQVNQRFTIFNLRPASVVASERNPVAYSITDRKFLDSLDLSQVASVGGTIIEPWVAVIAVVDSIAKRIIKKDGDTELTHISVPVPYKRDSAYKEDKANRVQIVVSNNGKYEYHFNVDGIGSAQDTKIDFPAVNKPTDQLTQAIVSDNLAKVAIAQALAGAKAPTPTPIPTPLPIAQLEVSKTSGTLYILEAKLPLGLPETASLKWEVMKVVSGGASTRLAVGDGVPNGVRYTIQRQADDFMVSAKASIEAGGQESRAIIVSPITIEKRTPRVRAFERIYTADTVKLTAKLAGELGKGVSIQWMYTYRNEKGEMVETKVKTEGAELIIPRPRPATSIPIAVSARVELDDGRLGTWTKDTISAPPPTDSSDTNG